MLSLNWVQDFVNIKIIYFYGPIMQLSLFSLFPVFFQMHPLVILIKGIIKIIKNPKLH